MVLVEAEPPAEACPDVWLLDEEEVEPPEVEDRALVGVPVDRLEPVGDAVLDVFVTVLFCVVNDEDELLPAAEESCVPWVVEEFALEEAVSVVTALAAAVLLPEVEAAGPATVVVAAPCTYRLSSFRGSFWNSGSASRITWYWFDWV
jgi:hypothetical protein